MARSWHGFCHEELSRAVARELYNELRSAAREADQPATRFAQQLMRVGLTEWRRSHRRQEIAAYARAVAGSRDDLDLDLERAGIASLGDDR